MSEETIAIQFDTVSKEYLRNSMFDQGFKGYLMQIHKHINTKPQRLSALCDVSFKIKKGEFFGLIGRNGAGKSTTLGMIAGVIYPTSGSVTVNGRVAPLLELGAGFHSDLTGRENILINGVLLGLTRKEIQNKFDAIVEFSELEDFIDEPMRTYSSGMYMRLGFSVAVHTEPDILLLDEVLTVGDEAFQKKCLQKMVEFKNEGVTIILVTHSLSAAQGMCDRAGLLDHGKLVCCGVPKEVYQFYKNEVK